MREFAMAQYFSITGGSFIWVQEAFGTNMPNEQF
jgi:hypothetical protein